MLYNVALVIGSILNGHCQTRSWVRLFLLSDYCQDTTQDDVTVQRRHGFNKADLRGHRSSVPPLPEQRRIVAKIDSLSAKSKRARDQLDHIPRLVEKYKQAILAAAYGGTFLRDVTSCLIQSDCRV